MATSIFTSQTPSITNGNDGTDYTLGTRFRRSTGGTIVRGRWYCSNPVPTGTTTFVLYSDSGTELARKAFVSLVAGAWNETPDFDSAVSYTANTLLRAAVYTPDRYVATANFFTTDDLVNDDITAPGNHGGADQNNGWLGSIDEFPSTISGNSACFFTDVVFSADGSTVTGAAAAALGALAATAAGVRTVYGVATAQLGALTVAASGQRTVYGLAVANLGALTATATDGISPPGAGPRIVASTPTGRITATTPGGRL